MTEIERIDCAIQDLKLECANYMADLDCWDEAKTKCKTCYIPTALEALEKQIPKKPYKDNENGVYEKEYCPTCNRSLFPNDHHCTCGQALDWGDKE